VVTRTKRARRRSAAVRAARAAFGPVLWVLAAPQALAQTASPSQGSNDEAVGLQIAEVIVTARRRSESLQDVPVSVSAFDARRIEELQAQNISGLQNSVPNLYLDRGDGANTVIFIRGIGQNDSLAFADAGVGVYLDDVFIARSQAAFLDLFDVQRVEVLRGPQGTLYGRNTIGGAVKFVSAQPPDHLGLYVEAGGGNFDYGTLKASLGGPIAADSLLGKVAVSATHRSGYATNLSDGEDDGDTQSLAWRGTLAYTPTDDVRVSLTVDGKRDRPDTSRSPVRETSVTGFADPVGAPLTSTTFAPASNPYRVDVNANRLSDLDAYGLTLKAGVDLSDAWTIESITAYREMDFDLTLDTDGTPLPILDILVLQEQNQFSQELRATYDAHSGFTLIAGLYYFHDDDVTFSGVDNGALSVFGFPVTAFGLATSSLADTHQKTESLAGFADASYELTQRLTLGAGVRYTYEEKESRRRFENFFDPAISVIERTPPFLRGAGVAGAPISGKQDFDAVTPKLSLSFKASDDALLYASVARGFKSGGFDGRGTSRFTFQPFDPETVWGYEAGLKSTWADGRVVANAAVFYNDYQDLQVTSFGRDPLSGGFVSLFTNAAKARTQGAELELAARASAGLTLNASLGYLDAKYEKFETLIGGVVTDVSRREMVNAPEWSASLGFTYERSLSASLIGAIHVDAAYRGKTCTEITASELLAQDDYVMSNAFVSVKTADERWELRGGVQNLGDEQVRVQGFNLSEFPGYQLAFYSARRTWDLHLVYRY
jgi:iron complex outermembrane recepter protein